MSPHDDRANEPTPELPAGSSWSGSAGSGSSSGHAGWDFDAWSDGLSPEQLALQSDLSCLVDGELDEVAAVRAMVALEEVPACRDFFDDLQRFARLHRDMSDPERLEARLVMLGSTEVARVAENIDLAHRLATIFYQLGKAYTLAALDTHGFAERVFEAAVPVAETKTRGRGFVDGVVESGRIEGAGGYGAIDWTSARHLLNGRLERIEGPLDKGRKLLEQAVEIDGSHEEARIYLAFILAHEGRHLRAATLYRDVFETAIDIANRGHAAMQLGRLHHREGDLRGALRYWRWMSMSGLVSVDQRFGLVHYNIALAHLQLGSEEPALAAFRSLVDAQLASNHSVSDITRLFTENDDARRILEARPGFIPRLAHAIPELFHRPAS